MRRKISFHAIDFSQRLMTKSRGTWNVPEKSAKNVGGTWNVPEKSAKNVGGTWNVPEKIVGRIFVHT